MAPQIMAPLINDVIKSIRPERFSPITTEIVCSDEEESSEEIPIRINKNQMRYISGLSQSTTCYDVLCALIDDELANTTTKLMQMKTAPQNYILTERYQDIERTLDLDERILELWQNWGENQAQVQFRIRINKQDKRNRRPFVKKKSRKTGITTLLQKVLHQGDLIQKHLLKMADNQPFENFHEYPEPYESDDRAFVNCNKATDSVDELFLVIESQDNDQDSGVFLTKTQQNAKQDVLHEFQMLGCEHFESERYSADTNFKFDSVHKDIRSKMFGMREIIEQENSFLRKLNEYCVDSTQNVSDVGNCTMTI